MVSLSRLVRRIRIALRGKRGLNAQYLTYSPKFDQLSYHRLQKQGSLTIIGRVRQGKNRNHGWAGFSLVRAANTSILVHDGLTLARLTDPAARVGGSARCFYLLPTFSPLPTSTLTSRNLVLLSHLLFLTPSRKLIRPIM